MSNQNWLTERTKSILTDTIIPITIQRDYEGVINATLHIVAIEMNYGPVIHLTVTCSDKFNNDPLTIDHPFMLLKINKDTNNYLCEILDNTPAVRALIDELVSSNKENLYTTTPTTHIARLLAALELFWS